MQSMGEQSERGRLLPSIFARKRKSGAPVYALVFVTIVEVGLVSGFDFDYLVQLSTLLHVVALALQLAAFIQLRFAAQDATRLWTMPGGSCGAVVLTVVSAIVLIL